MAVYQNTIANLGVRLEITHASPDIANNRTTITYKASVYKTGSHNPWNNLSQTPMYLTINGQSLHSTATGNYDLRSGTYEQAIKTGTLVIPHDADGSKSFTFSWNVNFTSTGYGYSNVTTSGTYVLPNIARASTFTIPSTTITTGSAFTVTIARASGSFVHKVSYIVGNSEVAWTTNAATSYAATVPHALFNSYKSTASVSGVIRVTTMNGSVEVGSNQRAVTINLASSATPDFSSITYSNSNQGMFSRTDQFIRGISRATATANTPTGSYSSTISTYEFRYRRGTSYTNITSKTTSSHQFDAFSFPDSGSENGVYFQARIRDSRGRYSAWKETTDVRVHYYNPPAIGTMTVRRTGAANTTLQVERTYTVIPMYELGGTTNSNTASLTFQHRVKGSSTVTSNTGAGSTTMSLTKSNANLSHVFATNTSYEVRAILKDKLNTVYGSWIGVGTEFVPLDIGPKGAGVGKIHSDGTADLEVGSGGISSDGLIRYNGNSIQHHVLTHATSGAAITVTGDWNNVIQTGFYQGSTMTNQSPGSHTWRWVRVTRHNDLFVLQESFSFQGDTAYYRAKVNGTWYAWSSLDPTAHFISKPSSSTNLNSMVQSGAYRMAGDNANMFPNGAYSQMLTIRGGNDTVAQMGFPYQTGRRPSIRGGNPADVGGGGGWEPWKELAWYSDITAEFNNSNGYSLRFADGVQIIGGKMAFAAVSNPSVVFAQAFAATPNVSLTVEQGNRWLRVNTSITTLSNSGLTASVIDFDAQVVANYILHYSAIGRWKAVT